MKKIACPRCKTTHELRPDQMGKLFRCPVCQCEFKVSMQSSASGASWLNSNPEEPKEESNGNPWFAEHLEPSNPPIEKTQVQTSPFFQPNEPRSLNNDFFPTPTVKQTAVPIRKKEERPQVDTGPHRPITIPSTNGISKPILPEISPPPIKPTRTSGRKQWLVGLVVAFVLLAGTGITLWFATRKPLEVVKAIRPIIRQQVGELRSEEISERLIPSTVLILTPEGHGSGILVHTDPHVVLTNHHVVGEQNPMVQVYFPERDPAGKIIGKFDYYKKKAGLQGKVVRKEKDVDLALVELETIPSTAKPIRLAAESAKMNAKVYGIGQSGAKFDSLWLPNTGETRYIQDLPKDDGVGTYRVLLTQQPINSGDSGGPVVNSRLELLGIAHAKARKNIQFFVEKGILKGTVEGSDNFSLVIDVKEIQSFLDRSFEGVYKKRYQAPPSLLNYTESNSQDEEPWTVSELQHYLQNGTSDEAVIAADLMVAKGKEAVSPLMDLLKEKTVMGRWPMYLQILQRIGEPAAPAVDLAIDCLKDSNENDFQTQVAAARFLGAISPHGRKALRHLWFAVGSNGKELSDAARKAILKYGPYGKKDLAELLLRGKDDNPFIKAQVVEIMCTMEELSAQEFSTEIDKLKLFESTDQRLRLYVAEVMAQYPKKFTRQDKFKCLIPLLGDSEPDVQARAKEQLDQLTTDNSQRIRFYASDGKTPLRDAKGNDIVLRGYSRASENDIDIVILDDPSSEMKEPYWDIRMEYPSTKSNSRLNAIQQKVPLRLVRMLNISQDDVDQLINLINQPNMQQNANGIAYVMIMIGHKHGSLQVKLEQVAQFLKPNQFPNNINVQVATLWMILQQRQSIDFIVNELITLCGSPHFDVRKSAIRCLELVNPKYDSMTLPILFDALKNNNEELRRVGRQALEGCLKNGNRRFSNGDDISLLEKELIESTQPIARMMSAKVLAQVGADAARSSAQTMITALGDSSPGVRVWVLKGLGQLGESARPGVKRMGELILQELDRDNARFTTDNQRQLRSNPSEYLANPGMEMDEKLRTQILQVKQTIMAEFGLTQEKDIEEMMQNFLVRRTAIAALAELRTHASDAIPSLRELLTRTQNHELMILTMNTIQAIAKDTPSGIGEIAVECLDLFKHEKTERLNLNEAVDRIIEANTQKRSPVSNAIIDMAKALGIQAVPPLAKYLANRTVQRKIGTDALSTFGAVECLLTILKNTDGTLPESTVRDLRRTLEAFEGKLSTVTKELERAKADFKDQETLNKARSKVLEVRELVLTMEKKVMPRKLESNK